MSVFSLSETHKCESSNIFYMGRGMHHGSLEIKCTTCTKTL